MTALGESAADAFRAMAAAFAELGRRIGEIRVIPRASNPSALAAAVSAGSRSEALAPGKSLGEKEALRSPRGASAPLAWIDETVERWVETPSTTFDEFLTPMDPHEGEIVDFGGWEDR